MSHQVLLKMVRKRDQVDILMTRAAEKEEPFLWVGGFGGCSPGDREDTMENEVRERELPVAPLTSSSKKGFDFLLSHAGGL